MKTQTIPQHRLAPWPLKNMTGDLQAPTVTAISIQKTGTSYTLEIYTGDADTEVTDVRMFPLGHHEGADLPALPTNTCGRSFTYTFPLNHKSKYHCVVTVKKQWRVNQDFFIDLNALQAA